MQFSLKTLLVLFVVFWTSLAAFGVAGIGITLVCVVVGLWFRNPCWESTKYVMASIVIIVTIILLLLPCISMVSECRRRAACKNNLKQLALALHNYHDDNGCFPPAYVTDKNGNPIHSWRTLLLPYVEEGNLFKTINLNEPCNGPNNQKWAKKRLPEYQCPSSEHSQDSIANYVAVTGPGTIWSGDKGTRIEDITDGTENTILLVEIVDTDIHWMEPRDITLEEALGKYDTDKAKVPSSKHHSQRTYFFNSVPVVGHVAMADGSVKLLYKHPSSEDLAAMLTIDGGELINKEVFAKSFDCPLYKQLRWDHVVGLPLFIISVIWFWFRLIKDSVDFAP